MGAFFGLGPTPTHHDGHFHKTFPVNDLTVLTEGAAAPKD